MRGKSFLGELIELAGASITLNLEIPSIRIIMSEPVAENLQTSSIKLLDFAFQQLDLGHTPSLAGVFQNGKTPFGRSAVEGEVWSG
ncbi:MAG: hypothetical protein A2X36_07995 [Elusimicrobia bacterium GWA2_69_24]|nr:MAG: hypothetical protein A2X36_07995 [Elusimicrobia bacterium GWA2_69_24]